MYTNDDDIDSKKTDNFILENNNSNNIYSSNIKKGNNNNANNKANNNSVIKKSELKSNTKLKENKENLMIIKIKNLQFQFYWIIIRMIQKAKVHQEPIFYL